MVANRPSSDDCSGWYRPNRIEFHEMTKSKKGTISKGQMEFNFRIEHTDPVVHQINDVTCIHFSLFIQNVTSNGSYNNTSY